MIKILHRLSRKFKNKISKNNLGTVSKSYISKFLDEEPIIVEAGAHVGTDTVEMAKRWPKGKIFAFEPIPELYQRLVENLKGFGNVKCYKLALSHKTGSSIMFVSSGFSDGSSSLLKPKEHLQIHPDVKFHKKIRIQTTNLDDWVEEQGIKRIDFLWLDIQGSELDVLKNAGKILRKVKVVYTEVHLVENYKHGVLYSDLRKWMEAIGFKVDREEIAWDDGGNVLFVRA